MHAVHVERWLQCIKDESLCADTYIMAAQTTLAVFPLPKDVQACTVFLMACPAE